MEKDHIMLDALTQNKERASKSVYQAVLTHFLKHFQYVQVSTYILKFLILVMPNG